MKGHNFGLIFGINSLSRSSKTFQNELFFGHIHIDDNIYFVDPTIHGSADKQRFSKLNDPFDPIPYKDPDFVINQALDSLFQIYQTKEKNSK